MEKEWFDQLTDAQKAKLKAMDGEVTIDRLIAFCKEESCRCRMICWKERQAVLSVSKLVFD